MRALVLLLAACATTTPPAHSPPSSAPDPAAIAPTPTPAQQHGETPTVVLPGDSVGPVHAGSTHAELVERIGEDALQESTTDLGEGVVAPSTTVYGGTERELQVVWASEARDKPQAVHILGSAWELPEGLHHGDDLSTVVSALGAVQFLGFGWDGGGTVVLEGTPLEKYADTLYLRLNPTQPPVPQSLMGSDPFGADHPDAAGLGLVLSEVRVLFP